MSDVERDLDRVIAEQWDGLVRFATILSGDPATAEATATAALVRITARNRLLHRRADLAATARAAILRTQQREWRRGRVDLDAIPAPTVTAYDAASQPLVAPAAPGRGSRSVLEEIAAMSPRQRIAIAQGADPDHVARRLAEQTPEPPPAPLRTIRPAARRRLAVTVGGIGAAAAAVIAVVVAGALSPATRSPAKPSGRPAIPAFVADLPAGRAATWPAPAGGHATGIAVGLGSAWDGAANFLEQRNPRTGQVQQRIDEGFAVADVTTCAGRVWSLVTVPAGRLVTPPASRAEIISLRPVGLVQHRVALRLEPVTFRGSACFAGSLWLPSATGAVLRVTPGRSSDGVERIPLSGSPQSIAPAGGQLWVQQAAARRITELVVHAGRITPEASYPWNQPLLAPAVEQADPNGYPLYIRYGAWSTDGRRLIGLVPKSLVVDDATAMVYRYETSGRPLDVATSRSGVFVATDAGVDFFDQSTLQSGYRPTGYYYRPSVGWSQDPSFRGHLGVNGLAGDGPGVLILDGDGSITDWTPPSPQHRG